MSNGPIYLGVGKVVEKRWGEEIRLTLFPDDIETLVSKTKDGSPVTIDIAERRNPSAKGYTHYARLVDPDFDRDRKEHSENKANGYQPQKKRDENFDDVDEDDIPF